MCSEPTSLAVLMAKEDKYAMADSAMRVKVTTSDKAVPTPATPKPARDGRGGQNNNKRKADQMDSCSNSKLVASVEGETSAPQAGPPRKRSNRNNANWLPKQSFEELLDALCKIHSGAQPSNHTLRQCSFARWLSQGDCLPAPSELESLKSEAAQMEELLRQRMEIGETGRLEAETGFVYLTKRFGDVWANVFDKLIYLLVISD
ncbi:hypothetical protein D1007_04680 [Hordeum vulgare]|nr:hypothetical protein D1007_04680 [Hordeum vulgare]